MRCYIQKDWQGETVYIIGGGPSLREMDLTGLGGKIIAINEAGLTKCPEADVLFFGDFRWYEWNKPRLKHYLGQEIVTRGYDYMYPAHIQVLQWDKSFPIHPSLQAVGGLCSGGSALDFAYKRGAGKIVLLGFDMNSEGEQNWHNRHRELGGISRERMIASFEKVDIPVEIINATPNSALTCFPYRPLGDVWLSK
jgi:uncharacterized Rossmann fold enzyme